MLEKKGYMMVEWVWVQYTWTERWKERGSTAHEKKKRRRNVWVWWKGKGNIGRQINCEGAGKHEWLMEEEFIRGKEVNRVTEGNKRSLLLGMLNLIMIIIQNAFKWHLPPTFISNRIFYHWNQRYCGSLKYDCFSWTDNLPNYKMCHAHDPKSV